MKLHAVSNGKIFFYQFVLTTGELIKLVVVFATAHDFETIGMIKV
jgi:hypothetical protein